MQVSIYAFRTLIWASQQNRDDLPANLVPENVLPALEHESTHSELASHGWLHDAAMDKALNSELNFVLSSSGKQRARRWMDEYTWHSAAYEILQAIPTTPGRDLTSAEDAFPSSYRDPITGEMPSTEVIDQAGAMLHENKLVSGVGVMGLNSPLRMELTQQGRNLRREHYVPTLIGQTPNITPDSPTTATSSSSTYNFTTTITGGTIGAAQFGQQNQATVENIHSELQQHFQDLRDLASEAPAQDRQELLDQIDQLEDAAQQGPTVFKDLRNNLLSGFATKLGERSVEILMAIPPLLTAIGG